MVDPRGLQAHGGLKCLLPLVGQDDKLCSPMMQVGLERNQPLFVQVIDDPLHILAIGAHKLSVL